MIATENLPQLVDKYRKPGPRYTSYPSALYFNEEIDPAPVLEYSSANTDPVSLYLHIPFCEKLCWFCGCHTIITRNHHHATAYLDLLSREFDILLPRLQPNRRAVQLHFGGGTPNFLSPDQIARVGEMLAERFSFDPESENSVELAPGHLDREKVDAFAAIGMNRASFGIQDSNPEVQEAIHRIQPESVNIETMEWLRGSGFISVNVDLIYGLPRQTPETFRRTLDHAVGLEPDRIALFGYAHVPWVKPHQKILEDKGLPSGSERLTLFLLALRRLQEAGYVYIGMDHFARKDDELAVARQSGELYRNFQGYSTRAGHEILAFGISSISQNAEGYRQNEKTPDGFRDAVEAGRLPIAKAYVMTTEDKLRQRVIQDVMCRLALDFGAIEDAYGIDFKTHFADALRKLEPLAEDKLVEIGNAVITVTQLGRLFIRNIAMAFDAYTAPKAEAYSKTV